MCFDSFPSGSLLKLKKRSLQNSELILIISAPFATNGTRSHVIVASFEVFGDFRTLRIHLSCGCREIRLSSKPFPFLEQLTLQIVASVYIWRPIIIS